MWTLYFHPRPIIKSKILYYIHRIIQYPIVHSFPTASVSAVTVNFVLPFRVQYSYPKHYTTSNTPSSIHTITYHPLYLHPRYYPSNVPKLYWKYYPLSKVISNIQSNVAYSKHYFNNPNYYPNTGALSSIPSIIYYPTIQHPGYYPWSKATSNIHSIVPYSKHGFKSRALK